MRDYTHEINIGENKMIYARKGNLAPSVPQCKPVFLCLDPEARGAELWAPPLVAVLEKNRL